MPEAREILWLSSSAMPSRTVAILAEACTEAIAHHGWFTLALSGGSSPMNLFQELRAHRNALDWSRTCVFLVDERCVPVDHELSNFGMMRRELLDHVPVPRPNLFRMYTSGDPEAAASYYAEMVTAHTQDGLDCVVLGMGADGHTASLFPDSPVLSATTVTAVSERPDATRLTLTLPTLNAAKVAVFYVPGTDKAAMLQKIHNPSASDAQTCIPARLVHARRTIWVMNEACAARS